MTNYWAGWTLAAMTLAAFAAGVAMMAISVAVPAIGRHWVLGQHEVHWVASGFMVAMLPAMLGTPWLLRRFGVRATALSALILLIGGGIAGAGATSFGALLAARVTEGLGAGVLQPLPLVVVARHYPSSERGRAMGWFTLGVVLAPTLAPALAGLLVDHLGWRSVLLAPVPFATAAAIAAWRTLPGHGITMNDGAASALSLFANAQFRRACGVAFVYGIGVFSAVYLVPVFVQIALQHTAAAAGAVLIPGGIALAIASPYGGRLGDRFPRHRVIAAGVAVFGAAHLPMVVLTPSTHLAWLIALLLASRLGMALALPSIALDALRDLPADAWPTASAGVSLCRQLGAALGIGVAALVLQWRIVVYGDPLAAFRDTFFLVVAVCALGAWAAWRNTREATRPLASEA